ncbi:BDN_1c_G0019930.mRNA.1.CDS.1 [Saccharomyces cerevisiae]|nr:BDN_1c_G0019930.mRNA.1.CDS.1 [Saccharomyces cerevisiae]CAI7141653.1 BDN_1c_G0019930.mRNA.1.CDS.1 [Saccharomyces cerevisiae]
MDNILKMSIPVKSMSEVSRPGSAALGNTDAMRASLRNSRRSFSGHVRLVLRLVYGFISAVIIAGSPLRDRVCFQITGKGQAKQSDVWVIPAMPVYVSPFQEACFVFFPVSDGDVNDFLHFSKAELISENLCVLPFSFSFRSESHLLSRAVGFSKEM